jgi:hypothetical protein
VAKDYEVGYGKPPKDTRFKPGTTGNPKGRPKGAKNLKTDLSEELAEQIVVREGDRRRQISKQRALVMSQLAKAAKGDNRAARNVFDLILRLIGTDEGEVLGTPLSLDDHAILENFKATVVRNDQLREPQGSSSTDT